MLLGEVGEGLADQGRDGSVSEEAKIMVDDAREITLEQAEAYKSTGKTVKPPKAKAKSVKAGSSSGGQASLPTMERVYIRLASSADQDLLMSLKAVIDKYAGETEVVLVIGSADNKQVVKLPMLVSRQQDALTDLQKLVGKDNVKIQ